MAKHTFKLDQYYTRTWSPQLYKVCPCNQGLHVNNYYMGECLGCKIGLMLCPETKGGFEKLGYCCQKVQTSGSLRKLTKNEILLKDF